MDHTIEFDISPDLSDPSWDKFLTATPGSPFTQTSLWAQLKAMYAWFPLRIIARQKGRIIGGGQILSKKIGPLGSFGYMVGAPILPQVPEHLIGLYLDKLREVARKNRIQLLLLQPSELTPPLAEQASSQGFLHRHDFRLIRATLRIDLTMPLEQIKTAVARKARQSAQLGTKRGMVFKEGDRSDLRTFFDLMVQTCERQGVTPHPSSSDFLEKMWDLFRPGGFMRLFFGVVNNEVVVALLVIPFAKTLYAWKTGWSGEYPKHFPNQWIFWETIQWAKEQGYHWFDFMSIDPEIASNLVQGKIQDRRSAATSTFFKLGFGGHPILLPEPMEYLYNPVLRYAYRVLAGPVLNSERIRKLLRSAWHKSNRK